MIPSRLKMFDCGRESGVAWPTVLWVTTVLFWSSAGCDRFGGVSNVPAIVGNDLSVDCVRVSSSDMVESGGVIVSETILNTSPYHVRMVRPRSGFLGRIGVFRVGEPSADGVVPLRPVPSIPDRKREETFSGNIQAYGDMKVDYRLDKLFDLSDHGEYVAVYSVEYIRKRGGVRYRTAARAMTFELP